jgi:RNA polymerase sigma-70 factor (ECF subfamily)
MARVTARTAESSANEGDLVAALKAGDDLAYARLVREQAPRMLQVARRLLGNDEDAQDALQDAFVSAVRAIAGFDARARLGTWLHRIVVNAALMKLRQRKRRQERSIDDLLPTYYEDGHRVGPRPAWEPTGAALAQRDEMRAMVAELLDKLPADYRTVVVLRDVEELDTEQAASVLGISPGAVKVRLHRARQALRTLVETRLLGERT